MKNKKLSHLIRINDFEIGKTGLCFIIAEAGVNHNGSLEIAKKLVDAAQKSGVDAVKFQTFNSEDLVSPMAEMAEYQIKNTSKKERQLEMLKNLELKYSDFIELKKYCDSKGILFLSTPHTDDAADFLEHLMPMYKIGSGDLTNLPLLEKIAKKGKPIILSTGMANLEEVREAVNIIRKYNDKIVILHCTTNYPCPKNLVNLNVMKTLEKEFDCVVGYSDHTEGIEVSLMAAYLGAAVIEKHFTLDKNMDGPDHKASINPKELSELVKNIRLNQYIYIPEEILGTGIKTPQKEELVIAKSVRKSILARIDIPQGSKMEEYMLIMKRPGNGLAPKELPKVLGRIAKKNISKDSIIRFEDLE